MTSYVVTVIGILVYLHYCGGELEQVTYLTKATSCCGEERDDNGSDDGCCKDEGHILKSSVDFTIKSISSPLPVKSVCDLFYIALPFSNSTLENTCVIISRKESPPPRVQNTQLISTSVLRI